jgi:hypothetical protein
LFKRIGDSLPFYTAIMPIEFPEHNEEQNIWIAASDGNMSLVQALLATGKFTPNSPDENGYTPMYVSPIDFWRISLANNSRQGRSSD